MTEYGQPGQPTRTTRDVTGFISGMGESSANANPYILTNATWTLTRWAAARPGQTSRCISTATPTPCRATAERLRCAEPGRGGCLLPDRFRQERTTGGGSAFVDDDIFGAQKDNDPAKTRIRTDGGD